MSMNFTAKTDTWTRGFPARSAIFEPLRRFEICAGDDWPALETMQALIRDAGFATASGHPVSLAPQSAGVLRTPYERTLYESGNMGFRERNWHDFFNVLACVLFPQAKSALNERHHEALGREVPGQRGPERDALTLFDESGVIVMGPRVLLDRIRMFEWHELFWLDRESVRRDMRFIVFGHALYEKALSPYVGMTGHALLIEATPDEARCDVGDVDGRAAAAIRTGALSSSAALSPLPLLGVPGWWPGNEVESFYANDRYFRKGRTRRG